MAYLSSFATLARWSLLVALSIVAGLACRTSVAVTEGYAGRSLQYASGQPNFDAEAYPRAGAAGVPEAVIAWSLPHRGLSFRADTAGFHAAFDAELRVYRGKRLHHASLRTHRVTAADYAATQAFARLRHDTTLTLAPGSYRVEVRVFDLRSRQEARQAVPLVIPSAEATPLYLGPVRITTSTPDGDFLPIAAHQLPQNNMRLQAHVPVQTPTPQHLTLRLLHLRTDTTIAAPLYALSPAQGSLPYLGYDPDRADTLRIATQAVPAGPLHTLHFDLPELPTGLFRLEATLAPTPTASPIATAPPRPFARWPGTFPEVEGWDALLAPLVYLADADEWDALQTATTDAQKRRQFDAFWGRYLTNRTVAADRITRFYERVEEANLRFSGYKAGWKTDPGLLFILFGEPLGLETHFDREVWRYRYDNQDPEATFLLERPWRPRDGLPHLILQRDLRYRPAWETARRNWRR